MPKKDPFKPVYDILNTYPPVVRDFPVCLDIELTNNCNLHCLMCPTGSGVSKRTKGYMSGSIFEKILKNIQGQKIGLFFKGWGEPLLHPECIEYIRAAKNDGHICMLYTNSMLLDEKKVKTLIDSGLDKIKFSVQGVNGESYGEMRQGADYQTLVNNIEMMHKLRADKLNPYMYVGTTTTYETAEQVAEFRERMGRMCDAVGVGKTKMEHLDYARSIFDEKQKDILEEIKSKQAGVTKRFRVCPEAIWAALSIHWNGNVSACNEDHNDEMLVGNINENSLAEIFHNPQMQEYRKYLLAGQFDRLPRLCGLCRDYMSLQS
jgi:radical SAM protein with 4Fe4S-binding SPASM domain